MRTCMTTLPVAVRYARRRLTKSCALLGGLLVIQSLLLVSITIRYGPSRLSHLFYRQDDGVCRNSFLSAYENYCKHSVRPLPANFLGKVENDNADDPSSSRKSTMSNELCPCLPPQMSGPASHVDYNTSMTWSELQERHSAAPETSPEHVTGTMTSSGRWRPTHCIPRHRIAIVVPFSADRERHLIMFLNNIHPFLRRQLLDYTIIVVEQVYPEKFNRGTLLNIGYVEAKTRAARVDGGQYDCFIFHDVDLVPEDVHNFYVCSAGARHMAAYRRGWNYELLYEGFFGGVTALRGDHFQLINGFSNEFFGWGGEDDDLLKRVVTSEVTVDARYPKCVSKYGEKEHKRDRRNPVGNRKDMGLYYKTLEEYAQDGLTTLNYTTLSYREMALYSRISVDLLRDSATDLRTSISTLTATILISCCYCVPTYAFYS